MSLTAPPSPAPAAAPALSSPPPPHLPPTPPSAPATAETARPAAAATPAPAVQATASHPAPMDAYAFGFKLGIAEVGAGNVDNPTYVQGAGALTPAQLAKYGLLGTAGCTPLDRRCHTEARRGVNLSVPFQLGGKGLGFRIEPYMTLGSASQAYGLYVGPTFEFQLLPPLYLGLGVGLKAAWVNADPWKYAGDVYGRVPVSATWYVADDLALVLEGSFGGGASAYFGEVRDIINPATGATIARKADVTFGFGRTWDLSIGLRLP